MSEREARTIVVLQRMAARDYRSVERDMAKGNIRGAVWWQEMAYASSAAAVEALHYYVNREYC